MPKINHGSSMIVEDHLKKVLTMTRGQSWKFTNNALIPRSQHSCFGNFPKDYLKKPSDKVEPVPKIGEAEVSIAAGGKGKLPSLQTLNFFIFIFRFLDDRSRSWWKDLFPSRRQGLTSCLKAKGWCSQRACYRAK